MAIEFKLPDIGEGVAEGEIVKWLVAEGDTVEEHQSVAEIMTDKATVEIPAPAAGTISKILAQEGDVVPVGNVIFHLETGKGAAQQDAEPREKPESEPEPREKPKAETESREKPKSSAKKAAAGGGSTIDFKLPDIGEGVAEGEIVKWLVAAGDAVEEHQAVVEVMTDKATVEIPAPAAGTLSEVLAEEGEVVPVGSVIFRLATGSGSSSEETAEQDSSPEETEEAEEAAEPQAETGGGRGKTQPAQRTAARAAEPKHSNGKVLAVPSARRVARELGIDLEQVAGSGRNGVIRRADVEAFAADGEGEAPAAAPAKQARAASSAPAAAQRPSAPTRIASGERGEKRVPFRGVRRKIAEAMTRSKFTAVHFTVVEEVDVTELVALREKAKAIGAEESVKVTYMPFIMKACAAALAKYPELNSQLDEAAQEVVTFEFIDLGIATDTPQGLLVPVIRDVQSKGLLQLARELQDLAERTRAGKVAPDELRGSTFTITNAGNIGGTLATPVINFPEVGILGVHRIVKRPGVVETADGDAFEVRHYMNLSISVDHRLVDGASGVRFLVHMKRLLEDPGLLSL